MKLSCTIVTAVLVAALVLAAPGVRAAAQMHQDVPLTAQQFSGTASGRPVQIVVKVESMKRSALRAELLDRKSEKQYTRTGRHVDLFLADDTPVVMGAMSDVHAGSILFVYAVTTTKAHADVKKLVVATSYLSVGS